MITQFYRSLSAVANPHRCLDSPNAATGQGACLSDISHDISSKNVNTETTRQMPRQTTNPSVAFLLFSPPLPKVENMV